MSGVDAQSDRVEWRARPADRPSRWVRVLGTGGGGGVALIGGVLTLLEGWPVVGLGVLAFGLVGTALVVRSGRPRTFVATETGLVRGRRRYPWGAFEGYEVTESEVIIRAEGASWRDIRIDRSDVDGESDVLATLDHHLSGR